MGKSKRIVFAAAAAVGCVIASGPARADEGTGAPWFPMVEENATADDVYAAFSLSVVRGGDTVWRVNRGRYRESVARRDFFVTVGRQDLAARETGAAQLSSILTWGGLGVAAGGALFLYAHATPGGVDPPAWPGLVLLGGGLTGLIIGQLVSGPRVTTDEVEEMTTRYNNQLKAHIEDKTGVVKPQPVQARLQMVAPWAGGSSFGLLATATF